MTDAHEDQQADEEKLEQEGGEDEQHDEGEKGLGNESGAAGGGESPPSNPDPSTKGTISEN